MNTLTSRSSENNTPNQGLGGGWGFPIRVAESGSVEVLEGVSHVNSCVSHFADYDYLDLIGTPTFGGGVPSMVFMIISPNKVASKEEQMKWGLEMWEPRINNVRVTINTDSSYGRNTIVELIQYSVSTLDVEDKVSIPINLDEVY